MAICRGCLGRKKLPGLGCMGENDCKRCKATGTEPIEAPLPPAPPQAPEIGQAATIEQKLETISEPKPKDVKHGKTEKGKSTKA